MQKQTPEEVAASSRKAIEEAGLQPGYLLMPGCDIPPSISAENVKAMVRTAHEFHLQN